MPFSFHLTILDFEPTPFSFTRLSTSGTPKSTKSLSKLRSIKKASADFSSNKTRASFAEWAARISATSLKKRRANFSYSSPSSITIMKQNWSSRLLRQETRKLVFPQPKMLQDFTNDISPIDKADDFHLAAAFGTGQRINLPHLLYALTPLW